MKRRVVSVHNEEKLEAFFRKNVSLYLYMLGDLDEPFASYSQWYGLEENGSLISVCLLYAGLRLPSLIALDADTEKLSELLRGIRHCLPAQFYAHFTSGAENALKPLYSLEYHGSHHRMMYKIPVDFLVCSDAECLHSSQHDEISAFYNESYPGNWFEPQMLDTGLYYGIRKQGKLASVAGVHVFSERYRNAALGNITTHPDFRSQGLGQAVTGHLMHVLTKQADSIGLNVKADNMPAIRCYEKLGFVKTDDYVEYMCKYKGNK